MQHLIIYAHPNPNSFSASIAKTIIEHLEGKWHNVQTRDLYALQFNPILSSADFIALEQGNTPEDIAIEHNFIRNADVLHFVYPLWWGHMPAILKGYIDRVFSDNFAYRVTTGSAEGLLQPRKMLSYTPIGNPLAKYEAKGYTRALNITTDEIIGQYCNLEVLDHYYFSDIHKVSNSEREKYLQDIKTKLDYHF